MTQKDSRHHICMIVQDPAVHGGIAAVTSGYYGSRLEKDFRITYVESYCDGSKWQKLKKALKAYRQFRKLLKEDAPELVHIHASFGPSFYREIPFIEMAAKRRIPVINHIHGSAFDEFYEKASERKKKLVRKEYGKCARLIVLSEHWKKVLSTVVPEDHIEVIPNYSVLHPEVMSPSAMKQRFEQKQVLYLGVLTEGKGMREMPEIIRKTLDAVPGVKFVLAGVGDTLLVTGPLQKFYTFNIPDRSTDEHYLKNAQTVEAEQEIRRQEPGNIGKWELSDGQSKKRGILSLPGWVRGVEKEKLLKESMIFLLPSHMEAMPMSILEAMGYGLPVVSTNVGGIPNLVKNQETGVLCDVGDSPSMADALIRYLTDEKLWTDTSRKAMERADNSFGFDKHLDRLEAVYHVVIDQKKS